MKHKELLQNEQACKGLTQQEQDQVMNDLIEYLERLEPTSDYQFYGKNELYANLEAIAQSLNSGDENV